MPLSDYFRVEPAHDPRQVANDLWNFELAETASAEDWKLYRETLVEQYKLYVEMADRISARRGVANTFFLTLNTAILTVIGVFWDSQPMVSPWVLLFPLFILIAECVLWFQIIRSYRQLNSGKWNVVAAMEQRLPASPWYRAEWAALGKGVEPRKYTPLTHVEKWTPLLFAVAYGGGFVAAITL